MSILEPSTTPIAPTQLPLVIREEGPLFEAFLRAYYEWEQSEGKPTYYARRFLDMRDVDSAPEEFLVLIKEKFLKGIRLETESNTRLMIKHASDLFGAKGTERGLDLFFRLLYDEVASVYYPKDDIFILSDGVWKRPRYLELSLSSQNVRLEGKKVVGLTSGATAYVDGVVRRTVNGRLHDTAYISALDSSFVTGEIVTTADGRLSVKDSPTIVGSMNSISIDASGSGLDYAVGDVLRVNSPYGDSGLIRVASTVDQTGQIELVLDEGGYGYTANSSVHVSNTVLDLSNVVVSNLQAPAAFSPFDRVSQPRATINFVSATGTFAVGDSLSVYTNAVVTGTGSVLAVSYANSTAGSLVVTPLSGNLVANAYYTASNAVAANLNHTGGGYVDQTASGLVVGTANVSLSISGTPPNLGEVVTQGNFAFSPDYSALGTGTVTFVSPSRITVEVSRGFFRPGPIVGQTSGAQSTVSSVKTTVGLMAVNGQFTTVANNRVVTPYGTATATFAGLSVSSAFGVANSLTYTETVRVNTDLLGPIANLMIRGPYGLTGNASANSSSNLASFLSYANVVFGTITGLIPLSPGVQQDRPPIVLIEEARTLDRNVFDYTVTYANATAAFSVGETLTQPITGARGVVAAVNSTSMVISEKRINPNNAFVVSNSTTLVTGSSSGTTAALTGVERDSDRRQVGMNARAASQTVVGNGAVLTVDVVDSGFGYREGEVVWLGNGSFEGSSATGVVHLAREGTGSGFYLQKGGFLSDQKKVFDGTYYQNYSYEITSSRTLDKYRDVLKATMHVAGMMLFGRFLHARDLDASVGSSPAQITKV